MDHSAGGIVLVPQNGAHLLTSRRVHIGNAADAPTNHNPVHRHGREHDAVFGFDDGREPGGTVLGFTPQLFDQILDVASRTSR